MDDVAQMFGVQPTTPLAEAWHREQNRKQFDIIRITSPVSITVKGKTYDLNEMNPRDKDQYVMYDIEQHQRIPFGSTMDIPYPRALLYVKHRKDVIVNFINDKMHREALEERRQKGFADFKNKAEENDETYMKQEYPKGNDEEVIAEIYDQLWVGMTIRAAQDIPPNFDNPRQGEIDVRPTEVRAMEALNKKVVDTSSDNQPVIPTTPSSNPFVQMNQKLTSEDITAE